MAAMSETAADAPSLIYVDLVEDEPKTRDAFYHEHLGEDIADVRAGYQKYLDHFQPWRLLIISGDNHEPLFKSTESYFNEADAKHAAQIAFGSRSNVYLRQKEHGNVELRLAA